MTESEWLASQDPAAVMAYGGGIMSDRQLRLFACAMWRGHPDILAKFGASDLPDISERIADGEASYEDISLAREQIGIDVDGCGLPYGRYVIQASKHLSGVLLRGPQCVPEKRRQCSILRDICGNPFRPLTNWGFTPFPEDGRRIKALARAAYQERPGRCPDCGRKWNQHTHDRCVGSDNPIPDGLLDPDRLAVLADALEDAGCTDQSILTHLRSPGPHVRGCHVLDALLGKE